MAREIVKMEASVANDLKAAIKNTDLKTVAAGIGIAPTGLKKLLGKRGHPCFPQTVENAVAYLKDPAAATAKMARVAASKAAAKPRKASKTTEAAGKTKSYPTPDPRLVAALNAAIKNKGLKAVSVGCGLVPTGLARLRSGVPCRKSTIAKVENYLRNTGQLGNVRGAAVRGGGGVGPGSLDDLVNALPGVLGLLKPFPIEEQLRILRFCMETLERMATTLPR